LLQINRVPLHRGVEWGGEIKATARLTNMNRTQALCDLLVLIFRRCSEKQPIVIALDDVQWMDAASWWGLYKLNPVYT
jgi:predicted ATPase